MPRASPFSPEVRERAIRMVRDHAQEHPSQWEAIASIAEKIGCSEETLRKWMRQAERDAGQRPGLATDGQQRMNELERENREMPRGRRSDQQGRAARSFMRASAWARSSSSDAMPTKQVRAQLSRLWCTASPGSARR